VSHSGCSLYIVFFPTHVAKDSFSQMSSHQAIVARLPNHMCAISCAATLV